MRRFHFEFNKVLGEPDIPEKLEEYIDFCLTRDRSLVLDEVYCENHHILPRSLFPQFSCFSDNPWNKSRLTFDDHVKAHVILVDAYSIPSFIFPLRLMTEVSADHRKNFGNLMWEYMRENEETFLSWSKTRSEHMKKMWTDLAYSDKMSSMSQDMAENDDVRRSRSLSMKSYWTPEKRHQKSQDMTLFFEDQDRRNDISTRFKKLYEDEEYKRKHQEVSTISNRNPEKRRKASISLKIKLADPAIKKKMSDSKKGLKWWTDGNISIRSRECPTGFHRGNSNISSVKGKTWWTNGIENRRLENPPSEDGWRKGVTRK